MGEEEAFKQYEQDRAIEFETEKTRKFLTQAFLEERRKKAREGFLYRATKGINLPKTHEEDAGAIE